MRKYLQLPPSVFSVQKTSVAVKPAVDRPNHFSLALCKLCLVSILTATDVMDVVNYG